MPLVAKAPENAGFAFLGVTPSRLVLIDFTITGRDKMNTFLQNMFNALNSEDSQIIIMVFFIAFALAAIVLRIVAHVHFKSTLVAFRQDAKKDFVSKKDVSSIKNGTLRKIVAEYIRSAERAVSAVPTRQIVARQILKKSFAGWKYENIIPFVESIELGLLWLGIALAVAFDEHSFLYGVLAANTFAITRTAVAFFNVNAAREQLIDEIHLFLEREIGRFYATDTSGVVLRLKNDLTEAIANQTVSQKETMENIGHIMASSIDKVATTMTNTAKEIGPAVAGAVDMKLKGASDTLASTLAKMTTLMDETLTNANETLSKTFASSTTTLEKTSKIATVTLEKTFNVANATISKSFLDWEETIKKATVLQSTMNDTSGRIGHAGTKLQSSSELLATHMHGHSSALSSQLVTLVDAIDAVKEAVSHFATQQEALTQQAKYIERNQHTLDASLHSYEDALKGLTQSLGDGLGAFINLHAQTSAQTINDALRTNIDKVLNAVDAREGVK